MSRHEAGRQTGSVLLRKIRSGTSGAEVFLLQQPGGTTIATKVTRNPRVRSSAQAQRRDVMAHHLPAHTPAVLLTASEADLDVIVTAAPATWTLDEAVDQHGPTAQLRAVWSDVVASLTDMWRATARPGFDPHLATRNHDLRCRRGIRGLDYALIDAFGPPASWSSLVVNDIHVGSWTDVLDQLHALGEPTVHITCHGDPHPGNVLVGADGTWHLVDWEWSGIYHDWRMMVSHLVGSWYIRDVIDTASGTTTATQTGLAVDYVLCDTPRLRRFGAPAAEAFRQMTTPSRAAQDLSDVARHVALLLLREIPQQPKPTGTTSSRRCSATASGWQLATMPDIRPYDPSQL